MRWLTPIILIVVLLTAACGHDPGGKDKIAVIDWDKAFSAHPKQTVLKQGEAELQKLLRYREEQAEIAKTQIAGLTRLQQLKQNSKANFLDAGFQTQMYAAEAKERKKLLDAYDAAVKEADAALAEQEKELEAQRRHCKEVMFDYNNTRPSENVKKKEILKGILGHCTDRVFIESPVHMSYGNHVHLGDQFYANFNLVIIDDMDVYIGNQVMIGPNVTICTTGHPVYPLYREMGAHYSLPIHIGNKVWIGANSVVLPGVTIGENSVIGAGSIVTRDIPANVVAVGNPCRVLREITETDREYYFRDMKVDFPYTLREEG